MAQFARPNSNISASFPVFITPFKYKRLYFIVWPNATYQNSLYNSEIENIYKILNALEQGGLLYGKYSIVTGPFNTLDFTFNDIIKMRVSTEGSLYLKGTITENYTF